MRKKLNSFLFEKELETCTIMQDKRWLGEAVINVLDNAIKYSPGGSKIFIRLQKRNDLVRMEIEDQGIGIPQNGIQNQNQNRL